MTNLSFAFNRDEYNHLAFVAHATSPAAAQRALKRANALLKFKDRYVAAFTRSGIPALWYMVINERESGSDFGAYLGNGQSLHRVTTMVPAGRGPWASWEDGAVDATTYDHVGRPGPEGWTWAWFLFKCEAWNGFGPRLHGKHTGYLWSGSQVYDTEPEGGGKYVADGVWDASAHDTQLGCYPLARAILQLDPSLNLSDAPAFNSDWGAFPFKPPQIEIKPQPQEEKLTGIRWLQTSLNTIQGNNLVVDGSYGRHTRAAVRQFQGLHNLKVDGQAGDLTCAAIDDALANMPKSSGIIQIPAPAAPTAVSSPVVKKGPAMDFTSIVNLAGLVAPQFVPALGAVNPLLPVAINVLGDALGAVAPHTADSVTSAASSKAADEVAAAIKTAADMYAKHVAAASGSAPAALVLPAPAGAATPASVLPVADAKSAPFFSTGGVLMNPWIQTALHAVSGLGGVIIGSGILDPNGPIAGLTAGRPVLGFAFMVLSSAISHYMVKASNDATTQAGIK